MKPSALERALSWPPGFNELVPADFVAAGRMHRQAWTEYDRRMANPPIDILTIAQARMDAACAAIKGRPAYPNGRYDSDAALLHIEVMRAHRDLYAAINLAAELGAKI